MDELDVVEHIDNVRYSDGLVGKMRSSEGLLLLSGGNEVVIGSVGIESCARVVVDKHESRSSNSVQESSSGGRGGR